MSKNNPNLRTLTTVIGANDTLTVNATGEFVNNMASTGSAGDLSVILGSGGNKLRFDQGDKHRVPEGNSFESFAIVNGSGSAVTVTVAVGEGDTESAQQVSISGNVSVQNKTNDALDVDVISPNTLTTAAKATITNGAAAASILAASTARVAAFLTNLHATNAVWVGDSNVSATNSRGQKIAAGQTVIIETTAAIYAHNNSGADVDIGIMYTGRT